MGGGGFGGFGGLVNPINSAGINLGKRIFGGSGGGFQAAPIFGGGGGRPEIAKFRSLIDKDTGLLKDAYQLQDPGGRQGLDAFRQEALREGPSKWAQLQRTNQLDDISKAQAGATSAAMNQVAATGGGLGSGAGERIARTGLRNKLLAQQGALGGIAQQDEAKRMAALQQLPGMELDDARFKQGTQQYNIDAALQEIGARRIHDWKDYAEQMKGYIGERQAQAAPQGDRFNIFDPSSWL
jgi:hypothetical protein